METIEEKGPDFDEIKKDIKKWNNIGSSKDTKFVKSEKDDVSSYIVEYDEDGKPIYRAADPNMRGKELYDNINEKLNSVEG